MLLFAMDPRYEAVLAHESFVVFCAIGPCLPRHQRPYCCDPAGPCAVGRISLTDQPELSIDGNMRFVAKERNRDRWSAWFHHPAALLS